MNLGDLTIEEVIRTDFIEDYKKNIEAFWWQIVELDTNLCILNKIIDLPFDTFNLISPSSPFWGQIFISLFDLSILIIWRISKDDNGKTLTLENLKDLIKSNSKSDEIKEFLENIHIDNIIDEITDKIKKIRPNFIAHFNKKVNVYEPTEFIEEEKIGINDLELCRDEIKKVFDVLCFNQKHGVRTLEYIDIEDSNKETDIDKIFDSLVKDSAVFKMPEEEPKFWIHYRENLSRKEIEIINHYRKKFSLEEI